jgi:catechol 2,3-dioxygenase-like lactoylglutathione lyase family enzyme
MSAYTVSKVLRISRNVVSLNRSIAFYRDRLGFTSAGLTFSMDRTLANLLGFEHQPKVQRLRHGSQELELVEAGSNARPYPPLSRSDDPWFQHFALRCADIRNAFKRLYRTDSASPLPAAISSYPESPSVIQLPSHSGGAKAFKFRDPDGHPVELIELAVVGFGKHAVSHGIDHSAISVSNVQTSIDFYTGMLGLSVGARQTNSGNEQAALDALQDPVVDVVAIQTVPRTVPHIELLSYHHPENEGIKPESYVVPGAADIASDRLVLSVERPLDASRSIGIPSHYTGRDYLEVATLIRDPDGHVLLIEPGYR